MNIQWLVQDFPGGANPIDEDVNVLFGNIFTENCMEMKEIRRGGCS